jgi:hypothetical protein
MVADPTLRDARVSVRVARLGAASARTPQDEVGRNAADEAIESLDMLDQTQCRACVNP